MLGSLDLAAALLLTAAGVAKLRAPADAVAMLRRTAPRLPNVVRGPAAVRAGGVVEAGIGLAVIVTGGRVALVLLAACYTAFAAVSLRLAAAGSAASCGCFGRAESPVGAAHVALNLAATAAAVAGAVAPPGPVGGWLDADALQGLVGVGQAVLLAYLGFLSITALPALAADRRRVSA